MLVSSFLSYAGDGQIPLAEAPCNLYRQLLTCSSLQSAIAIAFLLACHFCAYPNPPSLFGSVPGKYWFVISIPLNCSPVHGAWWGPLAGLPWIPTSSCQSIASLHQLCRHWCPSSSIGDEFNASINFDLQIYSVQSRI